MALWQSAGWGVGRKTLEVSLFDTMEIFWNFPLSFSLLIWPRMQSLKHGITFIWSLAVLARVGLGLPTAIQHPPPEGGGAGWVPRVPASSHSSSHFDSLGLCLPWCGIDRTGPSCTRMCTSTPKSWKPCRCAQVDHRTPGRRETGL